MHDPVETTRAARAASPASPDYFLTRTFNRAGKIVDRDPAQIEQLAPAELARRAAHDREAWFSKLALASAKARKARKRGDHAA